MTTNYPIKRREETRKQGLLGFRKRKTAKTKNEEKQTKMQTKKDCNIIAIKNQSRIN